MFGDCVAPAQAKPAWHLLPALLICPILNEFTKSDLPVPGAERACQMAARIFSVVDVWDALRSDRPYRAAWPDAQIRNYLLQKSGSQFDPLIVRMFVRMMWGD